jgi:hypothetical protein
MTVSSSKTSQPPNALKEQAPVASVSPPKTHSLRHVWLAVCCFYLVVVLFDSKGIYVWSTKLSVNKVTQEVRDVAQNHWKNMAEIGFEEPKYSLETRWLELQDAQRLLFPKKYRDQELAKLSRAAKKEQQELAWAKDHRLKKEFERSREIAVTTDSEVKNLGSQNTSEPPSHRTLIIGDSLMMSVGPILKAEFEKQFGSQVSLKAKLATGLARPDVFDWKQELDGMVQKRRFDAVIVLMGTNDSQDFFENNQIYSYGTADWVKVYKRRISEVMARICQHAKKGLWIGLPPMQSPNFHKKAFRLNQWVARTSEKYPCMEYLDTAQIFGDQKGSYESYRTISGKVEKIRMVDGIHITKKGAQLLVDPVLKVWSKADFLAH